MEHPQSSVHFRALGSNTVLAPGADIVLPKIREKHDYEGEFAFVIGAGGEARPLRPGR